MRVCFVILNDHPSVESRVTNTLPETNKAPETVGLENFVSFWGRPPVSCYISFRESGIIQICLRCSGAEGWLDDDSFTSSHICGLDKTFSDDVWTC